MRGWVVVLAGLMCIAGVAQAATSPAMGYYDQVQAARGKASDLVNPQHPDPARLQQAAALLRQALATLDRPDVGQLAQGNPYLRSRRADVWRDLAEVRALQGDKPAALDALDAAQAEAWYPDFADYLRKDAALASLHDEPRFKALLSTLDAMDRLWHARTIAVPYAPQLSEAERIAGLSLFWSEVKYNFVHFDHVPQLDWDQVYLDFLPRVIAARSTREYYEVLMQLAPLLHDGHTNIYPPEVLQGHFYARPPMQTALVDGHVLVTGVFSPTLKRQGIDVGDELLAIDGIEVHRYAQERVAPQESSSTPQDAQVRAYTYGLLAGDMDKPVHLTLRDGAGATHERVIARNNYPDIQQPPAFVFRMLPGDIAYLSLDHFESDAGVKAFEQHLPAIMQARGLILDVRRNGGGSTEYGLQILSYLTDHPVPTAESRQLQVSPVMRAQGNLWLDWQKLPDSAQPFTRSRKQHFHGPVALLIGPRTFSAAEDFTMSFDMMKRGLLVGGTTAGSTGQPLMLDLPGGGKARICAKRDSYPDGREFVGKGIAPDIAVAPTVADIRAGRDPVLARAAALIGNAAAHP